VTGQDAVVVVLGIRENPLAVRLWGTSKTPIDVRSQGTAHVVEAMRTHGVKRLVVQTTYGIGESAGKLTLKWRLLFDLVLKPQIADSTVQERVVRDSGLDWVLVQPVSLDDGPAIETFTSTEGEARGMTVSRRSVGRHLAAAVADPAIVGRTLAISAA
jgi:hypothetical protein